MTLIIWFLNLVFILSLVLSFVKQKQSYINETFKHCLLGRRSKIIRTYKNMKVSREKKKGVKSGRILHLKDGDS